MRPVFLQRAARRAAFPWGRLVGAACVTLAVALTCVTQAHAQHIGEGNSPSSLFSMQATAGAPQSGPTASPYAVTLAETLELMDGWDAAQPASENARKVMALMPRLAQTVGRAESFGFNPVSAAPYLFYVDAMANASLGERSGNCQAGAESFGAMLELSPPKVRKGFGSGVDVLARKYANCPGASVRLKDGAHRWQHALQLQTAAASTAEEPARATGSLGDGTAMAVLDAPRSTNPVESVLHAAETTITDSVRYFGGSAVSDWLVEMPSFDPATEQFNRFLWWTTFALAWVIARMVVKVAGKALRQLLTAEEPVSHRHPLTGGTVTPSSGPRIALPANTVSTQRLMHRLRARKRSRMVRH